MLLMCACVAHICSTICCMHTDPSFTCVLLAENIQMVQCMRQNIILEDSRQQLPYTAPATMAPASLQQNNDISPRQPIHSTPTGGASVQSSSGSGDASDKMLSSGSPSPLTHSSNPKENSSFSMPTAAGSEKVRQNIVSSRVPVPSKTHRQTSQKKEQCNGCIPSHSVHPTWNGHSRPLTSPIAYTDVGPIHNNYLPENQTPKLLAARSPRIGRCAGRGVSRKSRSDCHNTQPKSEKCNGRIPPHSVHPTWNGHSRPLTPPIAYTDMGPIHNNYLPASRTPKIIAPTSPSVGRVSRRDTVSPHNRDHALVTANIDPSDNSTRRSRSTECYSGRPAWNRYIRQPSPAPVYSKVGPVHTEYIPGWYLPTTETCDRRRSPSVGRTSRCDTASPHSHNDTPVNRNIDYSDNISSLKCRSNTSGGKLVSQSDYTRKLAPGCRRNESYDIPAAKTGEANQDVCNKQGMSYMSTLKYHNLMSVLSHFVSSLIL